MSNGTTNSEIIPTRATNDTLRAWTQCVDTSHDTAITPVSADAGLGVLVCGTCHTAVMAPTQIVEALMRHIEARVAVGAMDAAKAPTLITETETQQ